MFGRDNKMVGDMLRLRKLVDELLNENDELRDEIDTLDMRIAEWLAWADEEVPAEHEQPAAPNFITEGA